jgi:hypothetical protein
VLNLRSATKIVHDADHHDAYNGKSPASRKKAADNAKNAHQHLPGIKFNFWFYSTQHMASCKARSAPAQNTHYREDAHRFTVHQRQPS